MTTPEQTLNRYNRVMLASVATNILLVGILLGYLSGHSSLFNERPPLPPMMRPPMDGTPPHREYPAQQGIFHNDRLPESFRHKGNPEEEQFGDSPMPPMEGRPEERGPHPEMLLKSLLKDLPQKEAAYLKNLFDKEKDTLQEGHKMMRDGLLSVLTLVTQEKPDIAAIQKQLKEMRRNQMEQADSMDRLILGAAENLSLESRKILAKRLAHHLPFRKREE